MTTATVVNRIPGLDWSVVARAAPGETVSGDAYLVAPSRDGVLIGVVDGLGHGVEATAAARRAIEVLAANVDESVIGLVQRCHQALRETRGVVMTLLAIDTRQRTAASLGIGNVEMILVRSDRQTQPSRESALLRNGVVGYQLPTLRASLLTLAPGDVVVFATDGVREDFGDRVSVQEPLAQLVDRVLNQGFRGTDDALVLAGKFLPDA